LLSNLNAMTQRRSDVAAKRGILLLQRTSDLLNRDPPDLRGALAECQAAVEEDASNPEILRIHACFLSNVGHRSAAAQQFEKALAIDPISDVVLLSVSPSGSVLGVKLLHGL